MDPRRRQMMIRILNEMEKKKEYAKKLGLENTSVFQGKRVADMKMGH